MIPISAPNKPPLNMQQCSVCRLCRIDRGGGKWSAWCGGNPEQLREKYQVVCTFTLCDDHRPIKEVI